MDIATSRINPRPKDSKLRRFFIILSTVLLAFALSLTFCETGLRFLNIFEDTWPPQFQKYQKALVDAYEYANLHGYCEPYSNVPIYADGAMAFSAIDGLGYIGTGVPEPQRNDLLIFGDSFAYGFGVDSSKTFAARLCAYNAGLWGQAFPAHPGVFRRVVPVIKPKRAIWVLYPPHLISCTPRLWNTRRQFEPARHPVYGFGIDQFNKTKLSTLVLKTTGWGYNRSDYYSLEWSLYDASDDLVAPGYVSFEQSVAEVTRIAKENHVQVIPLFVPSKTQVALALSGTRPLLYHRGPLDADLAMERIANILERHGIPKGEQINLMDMMRDASETWHSFYFKTDAHFNETGSAAVAGFLAKRLRKIPLSRGNTEQ